MNGEKMGRLFKRESLIINHLHQIGATKRSEWGDGVIKEHPEKSEPVSQVIPVMVQTKATIKIGKKSFSVMVSLSNHESFQVLVQAAKSGSNPENAGNPRG